MRPRVTVVEHVYCETGDGVSTHAPYQFNYQLKSEDQAYIRRKKIGQDWEQVEFGWLTQVSMLVIENVGPPPTGFNLNEKQKMQVADLVIELSTGDITICKIPVGQSVRIPNPSNQLFIRCAGDLPHSHIVIHAFPK